MCQLASNLYSRTHAVEKKNEKNRLRLFFVVYILLKSQFAKVFLAPSNDYCHTCMSCSKSVYLRRVSLKCRRSEVLKRSGKC